MAAEQVLNNANSNPNYRRDLAIQQRNAPIKRQLATAMETPPTEGVDRKNSIIEALKGQLTPTQRMAPTIATQDNPLMVKGSVPAVTNQVVSPEKQMEDIAVKKAKGEVLNEADNRFLYQQSRAAAKPTPQMPAQPNLGVATPTQYQDQRSSESYEDYRMRGVQETGDPDFANYGNPFAGEYGGTGQLTAEQISQMTPAQMQVYQTQAYQENANQQKELMIAQQKEAQDVMANRSNRYQDQIDALGTGLNEQDQARLDQYKTDAQAQAQQSQAKTREAGLEQQQALQNSAARRGFSRSSTTEQTLQKASQNVIDAVADIENATGRAVNEYQAKLLDKQDAEKQKLMDRLDQSYNDTDALKLKQLDEQHTLIKDLMKQDPSSPDNMIKMAEKLQTQRIEQAKLDASEKKAVREDSIKNFQFMLGQFGAGYIQNMPPEVIANMAANMGVPVASLANLPKTLKEQENEWDKLKYFDNQDFEMNKQAMANSYQTARDLNSFDQDVSKIMLGFQNDVKLEEFKTKQASAKDQKTRDTLSAALGLSYGQYASSADKSGQNFDMPVPHPSAKTEVVSLNPKIATAYPDGYKFAAADGPGGLGGQCKWFAQKLTQFADGSGWFGGSSLAATKQNFDKYAKQGKGFKVGEQEVKPGMSVLSSDSKTFGHGYVINAIQPDGKWVVTESNYKGPLTVSNNRVVDPNDPKIIGILKTVPKSQYAVSALNGVGSALSSMIPDNLKNAAGAFVKGIQQPTQATTQPTQTNPQNTANQLTPQQIQSFDNLPPAQKQQVIELMPEFYAAYNQQAGNSKNAKTDFTQANQLYNRYDSTGKEIRALNQGLASIQNFDVNTTNAQDDASLIFAFNKVLDPASVVREGEYKISQQAGGALEQIGANWRGTVEGTGSLTKKQRENIIATMKRIGESKMSQYSDLTNQYAAAGAKLGFEDPNLFLDYTPDYFQNLGQQTNSQPSSDSATNSDVKSKVQLAKQQGYASQDIIGYLQKDPTYNSKIQAAINQGYSPDEILNYFQ